MANYVEADNQSPKNVKAALVLGADVAAGDQSVTVRNASGAQAGDFVFLGQGPSAEKVSVTGVTSATVLAVTAARFRHRKGESATAVYGDQVRFLYAPASGSAEPAAAAFTVLADVLIDPARAQTAYGDTDPTVDADPSSRWYRFVYRNSASGYTTDPGDAVAVRGGGLDDYCSLDDIRLEAGFRDAAYVADSQIEMFRRDAQDEVNGYLAKLTSLPLSQPLPQGVGTVTRRLAAGYLMLAEYGPQGDTKEFARNGQKKVDWAVDRLSKMIDGRLPLLDAAGNDITAYSDYGGFPDADTEPLFTIGQVF